MKTEIKIKDFKNEIIVGVIFLLMYFPTLIWMWNRWFGRDSYYSHGILIPFVVGFFIWRKKETLAALPRNTSPWGIQLIVAGLLIHIFSAIFRVYFSSGFSMILVLYGLILYFYGKKIFKELLFPISFLVFMVPLPEVAITGISFRLKLFAAKIAASTLNNLRIRALQDGSTIKMLHAQVVVDDVCSGLRSLISLTALSALFAYMMSTNILKRLILFSSAIPIAVITNVCRVVILASISEIWGAKYAAGFVHDATGFSVFILAFVLLFTLGKLLEEGDLKSG